MLPRGTGSPARIMCVNCNICFNNNTMRRYHVLELDTRVTSIICNWIHPQIISEDHYVCEACRDLAIRQVNDNLAEASDNQQAGPSHRGHCSVCLLCGSSILRRQSDMILQDNPSDLHLSMIEIIQSRVAPRQILMEPFQYIRKVPTNHLSSFGPAVNHWLRVPEDKVKAVVTAYMDWIAWIVLFDDITDNSKIRYGVPAAQCVYGVGLTINSALNAMVQIQKQVAALGHPLAQEVFLKRTAEFLHGEGIDMYWREHHIYPSEEAHMEMAKKKTGATFALPVDLLQLLSDQGTDYSELAIIVGVYYEILDDYYNLFHPKALQRLATVQQENYRSCSDITDGKITLAVIHASQFPDVATELAEIYKLRTNDPKLKNRAISLLKKHGSDEYTRDTMRRLEAEIRDEIEKLGGNPLLTRFMDQLSFQSHKREEAQELYS